LPVKDSYVEAANQVVNLLANPRVASRWDRPSALPQMTVGALAGHLGRSVLQVETYLAAESPPIDAPCLTAVEYYAGLVGVDDLGSALNVGVRQRAAESAAGGHPALMAEVTHCLQSLRERLPVEHPDRRVAVFNGRILFLDQYLRTRLIEITVHLDDLALSVGLPTPAIPEVALGTAIEVLVAIARARHGSLAVLRALTRRERDPDAALRVL